MLTCSAYLLGGLMMRPKDDAHCGGICLWTGALCKLSGALLDVSSNAASSGVVLVDSDSAT